VVTATAFDATVLSFWAPLLAGRPIELLPEADPVPALAERLAARGRTGDPFAFVKLTPAHLDLLAELGPVAAQAAGTGGFVVGGEALAADTARPWLQAGTRVFNEYGPTETAVGCCVADLAAGQLPAGGSVPIGRPIDGAALYVLDPALNPLPPGIEGELFIGGAGVAHGYWRRPGLTAERFLPDPFAPTPGARMYRTGDRAVLQADGVLQFRGRADAQVKLHGVRIEPGEIEAELRAIAGVQAAAVALAGSGPEARLVAYVVGSVQPARLDARLAERLPAHLRPERTILLEALPLTPNGKLDRRALAARPLPAAAARPAPAPAEPGAPAAAADPELLTGLTRLWSTLLQREAGPDSDFFDLGGSSLTAIRLLARIKRAHGVALTFPDLRAHPTPAALAAHLAAHPTAHPTATEVPADPPQLAQVLDQFRQVLKQDALGPDEDFFAAGGTSLKAIQALARLRRSLEPALPANALHQGRSARGVARLAAELGAGSAQAAAEAEAAPAPAAPTVSPGERQLWLDSQIGAAGSRFVMQAAFALDRPLEPEVLDRAIAELGHRHPVLRTAYVAEGEGVAPRLLAAPAAEPTLRTVASGELASAVAELARLDARAGFDLAAGRTWRVAAACAPGTTGVVLTLHHIVSDATSLGNVLRELTALLSGQALPAAPAADYRSYAGARVRAAEAAERRDLPYWRDTLAQPPGPLELPADRPRRPGHQPLGSAVPVEIEPALAARLAALAGARRIGLQAVLMAGYAALLHRLGGQDDLVVGVPVSERPDGHEDTVGLYLNTLPLRLRLDPGLTGAGLLDAVGQGMGALLGHRDLPFSRIVEALAPARTEGRTPLLHTVLDWRDAADEPARFTGAARPLALDVATAPFDLAVSLRREREGRILGGFIFDRAQFDAETVAAWSRSFVRLLEALAERPDCEVVRLPAVAPADLPRAWIEGPPARSVPELSDLLKGALAQHADRIALETPDGALTYAALGQRIAAARGGASGPAVIDGADPLDRVVQALAAVFDRRAIALIDPDLPAARRAAMRELLAARAGRLAERGEAAAYIQFTSGSTGTPKAAALGRAALANLAAGIAAELGIAPGARVLQLAAPAFDAWIWELFTTLAGGGTLVLESRAALQPGAPLARTLTAHRISHATMTPSAIAALGEAELPDLRVLVSAGEPLGADLAERWAAGRRLVNAYGPCEATVCTSLDDCRPGAGAPTIGRPIAGLAALVVDRFGAPAIPGAAGELWIAGTGVGLGYLGQPELTDARFVADPRPDRDGRVYRSGDVVRVRGDGRLQFVGRDDRQVKVHGVRIELDEVEHALASLPGVVHAAVRTVAGVDGRPALAAWVSGTDTLTADAVRAGLARALPQAMLPAWLGVVAQMPLTATGKVDRSALPDPTAVAPESGDDAPAADPGEAAVAEIMAELLRRPAPLGRWRNFFTLGGHSLLAVRLAARLGERLGRPVPLPLVFQHPTPAGLAAALAADGEGAPAARLRALRPADAQHDGAGPPAILVHSVDGSAAAYAALAAAWPPGRTVLALEQGRGFDDLDRMAEAYAEALLAGPARGEGPVLLAGWSLGAPVAAALAGRLRARGRRVGLVLIDAAAPGAGPDPGPDTGTDAAALAEAARAAGGDAALAERVRRNVALVAGHGFAPLPGEAAVIRAEATARPGLGDDLGWGRVFQRVHAERQPGTHHEILTAAPGELAHTIERLWLGMGTEERDDVA
jgi:amino acid adenylation domain-containing protein